MDLEATLEGYNPTLKKSFHLRIFWRILLYDLSLVLFAGGLLKIYLIILREKILSLPDPSTLFTLGAVQAQEKIGLIESFVASAVWYGLAFGLVLFLFWAALRLRMWSRLVGKEFCSKRFVGLLPVLFFWFVLATIVGGIVVVSVNLVFVYLSTVLTAAVGLVVSSLLLALLLVIVAFPLLLFLLNVSHLIIIESVFGSKRYILAALRHKKLYVPYLYMGLAFVFTALLSMVLKLFPETFEVFLSAVLLLLFFAWAKTYLFSIVKKR